MFVLIGIFLNALWELFFVCRLKQEHRGHDHGKEKYDIIHSMEVLYYLDNPKEVIKKISKDWLKDNGRLIIGIDHYYENLDSHSWQGKVGTRMLLLKEEEWLDMFKEAGFKQIESWRANKTSEWEGTLVITGKN